MILYKRNAQDKPIFWQVEDEDGVVYLEYGLVGKAGHREPYNCRRSSTEEVASLIKAKRKEGYKTLDDLYDNAGNLIFPTISDKIRFLDTYLPKDNTHENGAFIPMLCKTLEDNKPFEKHSYFGQWKINGERCIITASKTDDIFGEIKLNYRSRKGVDWTDKLCYLDLILLPCISSTILSMMLEEGIGLDGELYLPGYTINDINSFIKNTDCPQHYQLQYWLYDICIDEMSAANRYDLLARHFARCQSTIHSKDAHLNNKERLVLLPIEVIDDINEAITTRDIYINLGFEGLVIRDEDATYQFGGKRNNSMLKFKKIYDGLYEIIDIIPEGKRTNLPKFICRNDINEETFEATINLPQNRQELYLKCKEDFIGKKALVEYRERSGVKQVPFHAKITKVYV